MNNNSIIRISAVTALVLAVPLIAMQFTDEVKWTSTDFLAMGILLVATGLVYEVGVSRLNEKGGKAIFGAGVLAAFLLVWAQLAVGII